MDYRNSKLHSWLLSSVVALVVSSGLAGCYSPNIGNGAQSCTAKGECPEGYECLADKHCYKKGTAAPTCAPACSGATPMCDKASLKCVACLADKDCPEGRLCKAQACMPGCSATHPGCGADAGRCDVDMGQCRGCNVDAECNDATRPRCDKPTGLCVPCLPTDDKCPAGKYCTGKDGQYSCVDGCANDAACVKLAMMAGSDGGVSKAVTCCNSRCVDLSGDAAHCGMCARACPGSQGCCGAQCTDLQVDLTNCGGCGTVCAPMNVGKGACAAGTCGYDNCTPGFGDCDGNRANGCELSLAGDVNNCGACKNVCEPPAKAQVACVAGNCAIGSCAANSADCNKAFMDGCEVDTSNDPKNCGVCNTVCPLLANSQPGCALGKCGLGPCFANFGNCNANPLDGCEATLTNDARNCGSCGKVCPAGANQTASCVASNCRVACNAGFADCDGNANNGCEVDLTKDPNHCSACGMKCAVANGVPGCVNSACTVASCNMGFANCNNMLVDGCEVDVTKDVDNCNACGSKCVVANGVPACVNRACTVASCNMGFANCNNMLVDGCEINLTNDAKNCKACGVACANGQLCVNSACAALRPNVMVCGATGRPVMQFFPQGMNFVVSTSCAPDANTQALFITRNWANGIGAGPLQTYLNAGGIVLTEFNISHLVWNAAFVTAAVLGNRLGGCDDTLPSLVRFNPNDPFWMANTFKVFPNSGCGHSVNLYPGIVSLAGWDAQNAAVGYRDLGLGRLWATDFDWQDGQVYADPYTAQLMGYMMTHRR